MPESPLYELVYMSVALSRFSEKELTDLLNESRTYNLANGITGLLIYAEGQFIELLEGRKDMIEALLLKIKADPRHHEINVMQQGAIPHREFSDWSMAFLDFASPRVRALPGYSTFLESPISLDTGVDTSGRSVRLLHYFKAVMTASDDTIRNLSRTVDQPPPRSNGTS